MSTKICGIYVILNTKTGKIYIGQSIDIHRRWYHHRAVLRANKHNNFYFQQSWNKHGEKAFDFIILEICTPNKLNERELYYLSICMPKGICYNTGIDPVSPMLGRKHKLSDETKRKISEKAKGRKFSDEHRKNLGIAQRKRLPASAETRKKIGDISRGKSRPPMSEETRRKIGESHKGRICSAETRQKMSISQKKVIRKSPNLETRIKIGNAGRGRKHTPEAKAKISAASKAYWERRKAMKESEND